MEGYRKCLYRGGRSNFFVSTELYNIFSRKKLTFLYFDFLQISKSKYNLIKFFLKRIEVVGILMSKSWGLRYNQAPMAQVCCIARKHGRCYLEDLPLRRLRAAFLDRSLQVPVTSTYIWKIMALRAKGIFPAVIPQFSDKISMRFFHFWNVYYNLNIQLLER